MINSDGSDFFAGGAFFAASSAIAARILSMATTQGLEFRGQHASATRCDLVQCWMKVSKRAVAIRPWHARRSTGSAAWEALAC